MSDTVPPLPNWIPDITPVPEIDAGTVAIDNCGPFEAGSFQSFALTYTAGRYGIDDSGSVSFGKPRLEETDSRKGRRLTAKFVRI